MILPMISLSAILMAFVLAGWVAEMAWTFHANAKHRAASLSGSIVAPTNATR